MNRHIDQSHQRLYEIHDLLKDMKKIREFLNHVIEEEIPLNVAYNKLQQQITKLDEERIKLAPYSGGEEEHYGGDKRRRS